MKRTFETLNEFLPPRFTNRDHSQFNMKDLQGCTAFSKFPTAFCATDVGFQDANRTSGNIQEAMPCYSKKHAAYGYENEVFFFKRNWDIHF